MFATQRMVKLVRRAACVGLAWFLTSIAADLWLLYVGMAIGGIGIGVLLVPRDLLVVAGNVGRPVWSKVRDDKLRAAVHVQGLRSWCRQVERSGRRQGVGADVRA